jgi:tetratricopeptide (TPR) repeat protein
MGRPGPRRAWSLATACAAAWALVFVVAPIGLAQQGVATASAVDEVDALLRAARFEEAVARADALREGFEAGPATGELQRVRLEVVAGTAYVALEREDAARECFRRALAAEPALDLDPAATSPKVLRVFRSVRAEPRASR